jgi:streptomycin 6-kinase
VGTAASLSVSTVPPPHLLTLPPDYRSRLPRSWGKWVDELPEQVSNYLERWELVITGEFPLSYMFVAPVERADGTPAVLKIQPVGLPGVEGAHREVLGLQLADPLAVRVLDEDSANGVLLLERAMPGTSLIPLAERDDDLATETLAAIIRDYGRPLEDPAGLGLRAIVEHAEAFERFDRGPHGEVARSKAASRRDDGLIVKLGMDELGTGIPELREARRTAERVLEELMADKPPPYLIHGDLHHDNVLEDEQRGLLVIDPWGLYGDRAAEIARAMHNPLDLVARTADLGPMFDRRLAIYSGVIGLDRERLTAWCYVGCVISALWCLEDGGELTADDGAVRSVTTLRSMI